MIIIISYIKSNPSGHGKLSSFFIFIIDSDVKCQGIVGGLEGIDDELDNIGITFVRTRNEEYPYRTHDISSFPILGMYINGGNFIQYEGMNNLVLIY